MTAPFASWKEGSLKSKMIAT
jgi:hypothetical protein